MSASANASARMDGGNDPSAKKYPQFDALRRPPLTADAAG